MTRTKGGPLSNILIVDSWGRDVVSDVLVPGSQIRWGLASTLFSTNFIGWRMVVVQVEVRRSSAGRTDCILVASR